MRTTIKAVAAGLTLIGSMALAAWAMADGAPKDDKGAVVELMHAILPKSAYDAMLDQMYTQMSASMQQAGGEGMTVGKKNALKAAVQESLPALTGEVGAKMTPILMTRLPAALKKRGIE